MTVFQLGRMRHLDLLALYYRLNPGTHQRDSLRVARLSPGGLVKAIVASPGVTRTSTP